MIKHLIFAASLFALSQPAHADRPPDRCHEKVDVCHKDRHTITIDQHAVEAHLAHGDHIGECQVEPEPECESNEDCMDNVFCNGAEVCREGFCEEGEDPCAPGESCQELAGCVRTPECVTDGDCQDNLFCNGLESCLDGACQEGLPPCEYSLCSEEFDVCVVPPECSIDEDCSDNLFCTGHEVCVDGSCALPIARCALGEVCDEAQQGCFTPAEGEGEGEPDPVGEGEGEGEPAGEGEGEGEPAPSEGEGEGELTPSRTTNKGKNISGSSIFACTQTSQSGFFMFALIPFLIWARRRSAILVLALAATSANAESLTSTVGLISDQDTVHVISPDTLDSQSLRLNASVDYAHAPVTFRANDFQLLSYAVDNQATLKLSGAAGLTDDLQMDVSLPLSIAAGPGLRTGRTLSAGFTDTMIGFRLALNPVPSDAQVALTVNSTLPASFLGLNGQPVFGEAFPTITPGVAVRLGSGPVQTLVDLSYTARLPKQVADLRVGHTVNLSAAMLAEIAEDRLTGFVDARTAFSGVLLGSSRTIVPLEAGIGLRWQEANMFGIVGAGVGLLADVGVPLVRADVSMGVAFDFVKPSPNASVTTDSAAAASEVLTEVPVANSALAFVTDDEIVILQPVQFYFDSDQIKPESVPVLEEVAQILKSHPEIKFVSVQGHTSSEGTVPYNLKLSERRCLAVVKELRSQGVLTSLQAVGFGESAPLTSNKTKAGRETNRRVEFKIKEQE